MSNSNLTVYTNISPNKTSPRNGSISKITIHHMAGNASIETVGNLFADPERRGSSNYGVGNDGRVGLYVDEADRAWTSGSAANDNIAVTIEVANSSNTDPDWPVSDTAYNATIDLCVDICKRNGISSLNYTGDATGNLTLHKFFQATLCPGPYLESRMGDIASAVNARLVNCANIQDDVESATDMLYSQGVINTPSYWNANYHAIDGLGELIIAMADAPKNNAAISTITTAEAAITRLYNKGIISSTTYWTGCYNRLLYLKELLIAVAKRIA